MLKCLRCEGKGWIWVADKDDVDRDVCPACEGKGYMEETEAEEEAETEYMKYKETK